MPWSHSQFVQGNSFSAATTQNITVTAVPSGGVVTGVTQIGTATTVSVTDNKSNAYTVVTGNTTDFSFYSNGPISNGPTQIQLTFGASTSSQITSVDVWNTPSGTTIISADGNKFNTGFNASAASATGTSFTTTNSGDLVVSYCNSNTSTSGAGWTFSGSGTGFWQSEFQIQSSAGAINGLWTATGSWFMFTFALNASGAAAAPDMGGSAAIYRVQVPGWRWRRPPKGYTRRNGILLKAA